MSEWSPVITNDILGQKIKLGKFLIKRFLISLWRLAEWNDIRSRSTEVEQKIMRNFFTWKKWSDSVHRGSVCLSACWVIPQAIWEQVPTRSWTHPWEQKSPGEGIFHPPRGESPPRADILTRTVAESPPEQTHPHTDQIPPLPMKQNPANGQRAAEMHPIWYAF